MSRQNDACDVSCLCQLYAVFCCLSRYYIAVCYGYCSYIFLLETVRALDEKIDTVAIYLNIGEIVKKRSVSSISFIRSFPPIENTLIPPVYFLVRKFDLGFIIQHVGKCHRVYLFAIATYFNNWIGLYDSWLVYQIWHLAPSKMIVTQLESFRK